MSWQEQVDQWSSIAARTIAIGGFVVVLVTTMTPFAQEWLAGWVLESKAFQHTRVADGSAETLANVPSGAVVAFDSAECPSGWREEFRAQGRFIVGTGRHVPDEYGAELPFLELGRNGGSRTHRLTEPEMPSHAHTVTFSTGYDSPHHVDITPEEFGRKDARETSSAAGEDMPHNNMPPFLVLQFCRKD